MDVYSDDSELAVYIQSRALEAFVIARKWYRKSKLLSLVTFTDTEGTDPPRAAPTHAPTGRGALGLPGSRRGRKNTY